MATESQGNDVVPRYLVVRPERGGVVDLLRYAVGNDMDSGMAFLESSDDAVLGDEGSDHRWIIVVSIIVRKIIAVLGKPMEWTGYVVEFVLNLLSNNGNLTGLLCNLLRGKVVIPQRGTETFISAIGQLDGRIDLYKGESLAEEIRASVFAEGEEEVEVGMGVRALMDLCIMASKLAYENVKVVRNIVTHHWKFVLDFKEQMHFVDFYDCWNDFQKEKSTQVFIFCDKPKDANLILISFRGTEPFDADDWSTDFDYSWYEIPKLGKVHMGFLEALGLGNRIDTTTFKNHLLGHHGKTDSNLGEGGFSQSSGSEGQSTGERDLQPAMVEMTAYYAVRTKLKTLFKEHKNAKFVVTGHSLGGALAILFPTVLVLHEQTELMDRLLGVYTYGQPRIGNRKLGRFMEARLNGSVARYFRVVYSNDLVPRLPYDDKTFLYKHFGVCLFYDSFYVEQKVKEEPNKNFFGLRSAVVAHLNAIWELIRSFIIGYVYGPEYEEGWFSTMARVMGLTLPGISAHCPTDYVNSVRLGRERSVQMSSF